MRRLIVVLLAIGALSGCGTSVGGISGLRSPGPDGIASPLRVIRKEVTDRGRKPAQAPEVVVRSFVVDNGQPRRRRGVKAMASVHDVAACILEQHGPMSTWKLQKLATS